LLAIRSPVPPETVSILGSFWCHFGHFGGILCQNVDFGPFLSVFGYKSGRF
jgi:hypothetical protein